MSLITVGSGEAVLMLLMLYLLHPKDVLHQRRLQHPTCVPPKIFFVLSGYLNHTQDAPGGTQSLLVCQAINVFALRSSSWAFVGVSFQRLWTMYAITAFIAHVWWIGIAQNTVPIHYPSRYEFFTPTQSSGINLINSHGAGDIEWTFAEFGDVL